MQIAYIELLAMLKNYEIEHGQKPSVIALGKTHLKDLQKYLKVRKYGLYFEGIPVILHNDPMGIIMAHKNEEQHDKR